MNTITKWFLNQTPLKIFVLNLFGIPIYFWLFSIIFQLDGKINTKPNRIKNILIGILTLYPIIYSFFYISNFLKDYGDPTKLVFNDFFPFHITAMLCGLILMIFAANSYTRYEKKNSLETFKSTEVYFMIWFSIFTIWKLQPYLNKYVNENSST